MDCVRTARSVCGLLHGLSHGFLHGFLKLFHLSSRVCGTVDETNTESPCRNPCGNPCGNPPTDRTTRAKSILPVGSDEPRGSQKPFPAVCVGGRGEPLRLALCRPDGAAMDRSVHAKLSGAKPFHSTRRERKSSSQGSLIA